MLRHEVPALLPRILKTHYFFFFGALGVYLPYLPDYFQERGLTSTEIGLVLAILPLLKMAVPAFTGVVADRLGLGQAILRVSAVGSFLTSIGLALAHGFLPIALWMVAFAIFRAPSPPIADALALRRLPALGVPFGRVRLVGTVGFLVVVVGAAPLLDRVGIEAAPWLLVTLLAGVVIASMFFPPTQPSNSPERVSALALLTRNGPFARLLICTVLHSMVLTAGVQFLPIHLKALGHPPSISGMGWMLGVGVEILIFHYADSILRRIGLVPSMLLAYALTALRWLGTAYFTGAAALVLIQSLHGFAFGLFFIATVHRVQECVGEHESSTAQSLYSAASFGLGAVLGLVLFGVGHDLLGADVQAGRTLYGLAAVLEVAVVGIGFWLLPKRGRAARDA